MNMVHFKKGKLVITTNHTTEDLHIFIKSSNILSAEILTGNITDKGRAAMANLQQLVDELIPDENQFNQLTKKRKQ